MVDVKTAYLQGNVRRDVYIQEPRGFEIINHKPGKPYVIWKLRRAVYGLGDSAKPWGDEFSSGLQQLGWKPTLSASCIVTRGISECYSIISIYVDDVTITSASTDELRKLKHETRQKFEIEDLGETNNVLGLEINRNKDHRVLSISQ